MAEKNAVRVLMVVPSLGHGGAERVAVKLIEHFVSVGTVVVLVTVAAPATDFYPVPEGVERHSLDASGFSRSRLQGLLANLVRIWRLRKIVRATRSQVLLGFTGRTNVLTILAGLGTGARIVVSERTHPPLMPLGNLWERLRRQCYRWADLVVAQTDAASAWLNAHTLARRVTVIPNAVWRDVPVLPDAPCPQPDDLIASERKLLLAVGRLSPEKGFDALLRAFTRLGTQRAGWTLVVLGEGEERDALRALADDEHVLLPGVVGNVAHWYRRASLVAITSQFEGFPNAALEALASGVPIVAFDCAPIMQQLIVPGLNGQLVPKGDVAALSEQLAQLMTDPPRLAGLAANAASSVSAYGEAAVLTQWRDALSIPPSSHS